MGSVGVIVGWYDDHQIMPPNRFVSVGISEPSLGGHVENVALVGLSSRDIVAMNDLASVHYNSDIDISCYYQITHFTLIYIIHCSDKINTNPSHNCYLPSTHSHREVSTAQWSAAKAKSSEEITSCLYYLSKGMKGIGRNSTSTHRHNRNTEANTTHSQEQLMIIYTLSLHDALPI